MGSPLAIKGTEGLVVNFAKCRSPIPGDPIIGYVSSGRGLVIHTENCKNVEEFRDNPEKCVILSWDKDIDSEFTVDLKVYLENRRGIIAELASAVTQAEANIEKISVEERDARLSVTHLTLSIHGRKHLARTIRRLRTIRGVNKIVRTRKEPEDPRAIKDRGKRDRGNNRKKETNQKEIEGLHQKGRGKNQVKERKS